jgi:hypothetical protein
MASDARCISVVTAVHEAAAVYLARAYRSLQVQGLPSGWHWQWVIQEDGDSQGVRDAVPSGDRRVSYASGRSGGPAVARTLALARARGDIVKVLDSDDELTPGALARDLEVFAARPDIGWVTSRAADLHPDGTTTPAPHAPAPGLVPRATLTGAWRDDETLLVHPATLAVRRDLLLALGGWTALPASEDTALLLAASVVAPGWFLDQTGLLYRKWSGQMTAHPPHHDLAERASRHRVIDQRLDTLGLLWPHGWNADGAAVTVPAGRGPDRLPGNGKDQAP